jgi:WD40 repeat protein
MLLSHGSPVRSLAVLADGRLTSGGEDGNIRLWSKDGKGEPVVLAHGSSVLSLAVLADGRLASGDEDGEIKLWPRDGMGEPVVHSHGSNRSSLWPGWRMGGWPAAAKTARSSCGPRRVWASRWSSPSTPRSSPWRC